MIKVTINLIILVVLAVVAFSVFRKNRNLTIVVIVILTISCISYLFFSKNRGPEPPSSNNREVQALLTPSSYSNRFSSLRWETAKIQEKNIHASIDIEYPQFIGGPEVKNLNLYIRNLVLGWLDKDREMVNKWLANKDDRFWDETCGGEPIVDELGEKLLWQCSVILSSKYQIASITNDIVSIEMVFTDFTGGGSGNHDTPVIINYDLKSNRPLETKDLFCKGNYPDALPLTWYKKVYEKILELYGNNPEEITKLTQTIDEEAKGSYTIWKQKLSYYGATDFGNILLGHDGITIVFPPYEVASGAIGIVHVDIPYSSALGVICLP